MLLLPLRYQHSASLFGFWWWVDRRDSNPLILVSQTSSAIALDSANMWRKVEESNPYSERCTSVFKTDCRPFSGTFRLVESEGFEPSTFRLQAGRSSS